MKSGYAIIEGEGYYPWEFLYFGIAYVLEDLYELRGNLHIVFR